MCQGEGESEEYAYVTCVLDIVEDYMTFTFSILGAMNIEWL